jgi:hypothetical protein
VKRILNRRGLSSIDEEEKPSAYLGRLGEASIHNINIFGGHAFFGLKDNA